MIFLLQETLLKGHYLAIEIKAKKSDIILLQYKNISRVDRCEFFIENKSSIPPQNNPYKIPHIFNMNIETDNVSTGAFPPFSKILCVNSSNTHL